MAELFIEILSEEIPALMQEAACENFVQLLKKSIASVTKSSAVYEGFVTPRRLICHVANIDSSTLENKEIIRGPRVNADSFVLESFMKKVGAKDKSELKNDGTHFLYEYHTPKVSMHEFLAKALPDILKNFPWLRSMKWGNVKDTWIRPILSILCILDGKVINFKYADINSGELTLGYRKTFGHDTITVASFLEYKEKLTERGIILDSKERLRFIKEHAQVLLHNAGMPHLKVIDDEANLKEITGLVEIPNLFLASIDSHFLKLPREVIITTLRNNQRYILLENEDKSISSYFIIVSNGMNLDPKAVIEGNQRVSTARLRDAEFFYNNDLKIQLLSRLDRLKTLVFHESIGTVYDKVKKMIDLGLKINEYLGNKLDTELIKQVITLSKCDLTTEMVGEFPELQGVMGYYYSKNQGLKEEYAYAIYDQYKPVGPNDNLPRNLLGAVVALSDKLHDLIELFSIGIKPTGSKDPYAERRAAIGVIRIIMHYNLPIKLAHIVHDKDLLNFILERLKVILASSKNAEEVERILESVVKDDYNFSKN